MINADMRIYNYYTIGGNDAYGLPQMSENPVGTIKMAINITSQSIQDNIKYKNASYVGLTMDKNIDDTFVIAFGKEKLKVLYVNPNGRFKQVFMGEML